MKFCIRPLAVFFGAAALQVGLSMPDKLQGVLLAKECGLLTVGAVLLAISVDITF